MPQISALIHDTYRPVWLDGSCENQKTIDYVFLSCGCSHILLALCQECPCAGLLLSLLLHLYSGFMWIYLKTTQVWASQAMEFLFPKLQTGAHPSFLFLFLNHCSFMFFLGLNSTWTKCHNFLLHFADHKQKNMPLRCSLESEHKGSKWTQVSSIFCAVRNYFCFLAQENWCTNLRGQYRI